MGLKAFRRDALAELVKYTVGLALLGIVIELIAQFSILPSLADTIKGIFILWDEGSLQHNIQVSTARWLIGWVIGCFVGVIIGLLTGRIKPIRLTFEGLFVIFRAIPFICLVPISILLFGLDEAGKFFLVAWASATVTWVIVHDTSQNIAPHHKWRAMSLGASNSRWIFKILLPTCSEGIFSALRASLSIGLIVVAVAEMSGVYEASSGYWWSEGLGYRMFKSLDEARNDLLMATIITFAILGIVGDMLFRALWRLMALAKFRYRQKEVSGEIEEARNNREKFVFTWQDAVPLEIKDLTSGYDNEIVIDGLSLKIQAGQTVSLVGPSGCGKTTLIRSLGHFTDEVFHVSNGVMLGKNKVHSPGPKVGIVMQEAPVFEHMTVWDNIKFGNKIQSEGKGRANQTALYLLREFGIVELAIQKAGSLSGGQRQRVAMAMTVANRPDLLLLDEPFGALDAITRRNLQKFYAEIIHKKVTAVFVTHDVEEALLVGDYVRLGVEKDGKSIKIDKEDLPPHEWELRESFGRYRTKIISALEKIKA